jgi:hydroxymethylpyrimidine/phosphomethylpyrimidine kinase
MTHLTVRQKGSQLSRRPAGGAFSPMPQPLPPIVLCFAAADPSGGGGLQADLLTLSSMGCHALSVVTALTVRDTASLEATLAIDADWVADQARLLLEDIAVQAFKIGHVGSAENVAAIAEVVSDYPDVPLILDPLAAYEHGQEGGDEELAEALREFLLPQTTILTLNGIEARRLASPDGVEAEDLSLEACASALLALGAEYVLITGAHERTPQVLNTLYGETGVVRTDSWERLPGSYHGAGGTLAAALAAALVNGLELSEAVREAQEYTWQTLAAAFRPGMGRFIPDRFFWAREAEEESTDRVKT